MAKRKTPKVEKPQLETGNVEIQVDGAKVNIPVLVKRLLDDQRSSVQYFEHLLSLWYYKEYNEDTATDFSKELARWTKENVQKFDERMEDFKKHDKENLENSEVN